MNAKANYVNMSSQLYTKCGLFLETFPDSVISLDIAPIEKLKLPENAYNNHAFPLEPSKTGISSKMHTSKRCGCNSNITVFSRNCRNCCFIFFYWVKGRILFQGLSLVSLKYIVFIENKNTI